MRLKDDQTGAPGRWFWRVFEPIRPELDRLFWCFPWPPWMGTPGAFDEDETAWATFEADGVTDTMLWRPGSLGRYAQQFAEESIELWGIDPAKHDAQRVAALYDHAPVPEMARVIKPYAHSWLLYTDSTCWEIYTLEGGLLQRLREHLASEAWAETFVSDSDEREAAFRAAGLSEVWSLGVAEPAAAPNGSPAASPGNSEVDGGPPSVS